MKNKNGIPVGEFLAHTLDGSVIYVISANPENKTVHGINLKSPFLRVKSFNAGKLSEDVTDERLVKAFKAMSIAEDRKTRFHGKDTTLRRKETIAAIIKPLIQQETKAAIAA